VQLAWPTVTFLVDGGVVIDGVSFWGCTTWEADQPPSVVDL
jgi:hypothetical protein